jgi:fatty-acyl-CoA synthase
VPDFVKAPRQDLGEQGVTLWSEALAANIRPGPVTVGPDDLCVMPYTSGTTGHPKGCMHTPPHGAAHPDGRLPVVRHPAGRGVPGGAALLPRHRHAGQHERPAAGRRHAWCCCRAGTATPRRSASQRYGVTSWTAIPTMVIDFLMNPKLADYDLSRACA